MDKIAKHNDLTCEFTEANHQYKIVETGQILTSGTTLVKSFFPVFETDKIAKKSAAKRGVDAEVIKTEWRLKGEKASLEGTAVHDYAESLFFPTQKSKPLVEPKSRADRIIKQLFVTKKRLLQKYIPVEAEKLIFSPGLGIAGQIDMLMVNKRKRNEMVIVDWKTNADKLSNINDFQSGLGPLSHLDNAKLNYYSLQLSLYQYILEIEDYYPEIESYKRLLMHLRERKTQLYSCKYLETEIESMLI